MPFLIKLAETVAWSIASVLILLGSLWLFDRLDPTDFQQEIRDGNIAAGIILGSIILAIGAIVVAVLLSP
jgi:uncharacterized membrane protein YjfL (UPF0719 family)